MNEHRLTLGDWERSQILPITDEIQQLLKTGRIVTQVGAGVTGAAAITAAVGVGLAGYGIYAWLMEDGIFAKAWDAIKNTAKAAGEGVFGGPASWFGVPAASYQGGPSADEWQKMADETGVGTAEDWEAEYRRQLYGA